MSALNIPDEASSAFLKASMLAPSRGTAYLDGLDAAAPLIVAAELERLADEIWQELKSDTDQDYSDGVDDCCVRLRARAAELRGEQSTSQEGK